MKHGFHMQATYGYVRDQIAGCIRSGKRQVYVVDTETGEDVPNEVAMEMVEKYDRGATIPCACGDKCGPDGTCPGW